MGDITVEELLSRDLRLQRAVTKREDIGYESGQRFITSLSLVPQYDDRVPGRTLTIKYCVMWEAHGGYTAPAESEVFDNPQDAVDAYNSLLIRFRVGRWSGER